jgi:hypothetical protein
MAEETGIQSSLTDEDVKETGNKRSQERPTSGEMIHKKSVRIIR